MSGSMDSVPISAFMTREVKTANRRQSFKEVTKLMYENDIGCVVIVDHLEPYKPVGIVTERDILKVVSLDQIDQSALPHEISLLDLTVQTFMSKPVITIFAVSTLWDAIQVMQQKGIRRLPVTDNTNERLVGIITEKDIMNAMAKDRAIFSDIVDRLPSSSLMTERIREFALDESFFWPDDDRQMKR